MRRVAKEGLGQAEKARAAGDSQALAVAVDKALRDLMGAKLRVVGQGLSLDEIAARLESAGCPSDKASQVQALLQECDRLRFAPGNPDRDSLDELFARAQALVAALDRWSPQRQKTKTESGYQGGGM